MPELRRITDDAGAGALADRLNGGGRTRPVVVVTIPSGRTAPYIDAEYIFGEIADLADVYVIATGPHTWTFSNKMPELTQVYGGAGRVYPVGHEWVTRPQASPLRFAFDQTEGERSTRALVSDTLRMAASAGLLQKAASRHRTRVQGHVIGIPVPERALVKLDGGVAPVAQELTLPGVPLERVLTVGMTVTGWYDSETRRLDISESLLSPVDALVGYSVGEIVLAEVKEVFADSAELMLHPLLAVKVPRDAVTSNELGDLRTLMTPGEVLSARVVSAAPTWRLTLVDIDNDDLPRAAASILMGGPPWLVSPPTEESLGAWADEPPLALPELLPEALPMRRQRGERDAAAAVRPEASPVQTGEPAASQPPSHAHLENVVPNPAIFDRRRTAAPQPKNTEAATMMARTLDGLKSDLAAAGRDVRSLREELLSGAAERRALVESRESQDRQIARLEHELQVQRARLRKAKPSRPPVLRSEPAFADPEQAFRYAVLTAWATRTPVGEQRARPLSDYAVGPGFLESVARVDGISLEKIADVVFEVVTGRAHQIAGRDLRRLRESITPNAPYVRRAVDDATCWRAALQVNTPQARRLHYWVLPGGHIELSRVALHDDYTP